MVAAPGTAGMFLPGLPGGPMLQMMPPRFRWSSETAGICYAPVFDVQLPIIYHWKIERKESNKLQNIMELILIIKLQVALFINFYNFIYYQQNFANYCVFVLFNLNVWNL